MKKIKLLTTLSAIVMTFVLSFTGCQTESESHQHSFAETWTYDEINHWHAATCEHTNEVSGKASHTFGVWTVIKEATEETEGKQERVCTVCSYKDEQNIPMLDHTHKFAQEWTYDEINHWHVCSGCDEVSNNAAHTFGEWSRDEADHWHVCSVCGKVAKAEHNYGDDDICDDCGFVKGFVKVTGKTITGTETWVPTSKIFVSGRVLTIQDLYVSDHEVTQAEYEKYCKYGSWTPDETYGVGNNYPAYFVNWYDAIVYCNLRSIGENLNPAYKIGNETDPRNWSGIVGDADTKYCGPSSADSTWDEIIYDTSANGYRLPTEAEWEYIAREAGTSITTYSGSENIGDVAWYKGNSNSIIHEVKSKNANALGIYDMSGNIAEWCWDWYSSTIDSSTPEIGFSSGDGRVFPGGAWSTDESWCAIGTRTYGPAYYRSISNMGFRVVRTVK